MALYWRCSRLIPALKTNALFSDIYVHWECPFLSFFSFSFAQGDFSCVSSELFTQITNGTYGCDGNIGQELVPEVIVKINIHFVEGINNSFYPGEVNDNNIWNGNKAIEDMLTKLNNDYLPNMLPHPNPLQPAIIGDSKIRFALYSDPNNKEDLYNGIWYHQSEPEISAFPYGNEVLNIIVFSERPASNAGLNGQAFLPGSAGGYMKVYNWGNKLAQEPQQNHPYFSARIIMHELGHLAGLSHSFKLNQTCSDIIPSIECEGGVNCPDLFLNCTACDANTNNIMGYGQEKRSLTPCQWRTYYGFLYGNIPMYVDVSDSDCSDSFSGDDPYIIHTGEHIVFDELIYMPYDIIIEANASLKITCRLLIAEKKSITVRRAGRLIVDNGVIQNAGELQWKGIYVEGNGNKEQPNPSFANPNYSDLTLAGSVILNAATIIGAQTAIHTRHRTDWWREEYWGGVIAAYSTQFIDNGRAIEFMRYAVYDEDSPELLPNKSFFDECIFDGHGEQNQFDSPFGVTIWGCNGIDFKSCTFENIESGIYGINCGFKISNNTGTGVNQTLFRDVPRGIEVFNTYNNRAHNIIVDQAVFESSVPNTYHIMIEAASELFNMSITECTFTSGEYGIVIDGPAGYSIVNNTFEGLSRSIYINGSGSSSNEILCNTLLTQAGLYGLRLNQNNSGLQIKYNDFYNNGWTDVIITGADSNLGEIGEKGKIGGIQGGTFDPARNCFNTESQGIISYPNNAEQFIYVVHPNLPPFYDGCVLSQINNLTYPPESPLVPYNYYLEELDIELELIENIDCSHTPPGDTKPEDKPDRDKYDEFKKQLAYYQDLLNNGGILGEEEQKQLYHLKQNFKDEKRDLLAAYQYYANYGDMETLLLEEDTEQNNRWLLGVYFQVEDWDKAAQLIDLLPTTTKDQQNYHDAMAINLAALQQGYIYELSEQEEADLYDMAYSDVPSRAYARSILALLKMAHFEPDEIDLDIQALEIDINTGEQPTPSVRYYPNPTAETIYVTISAAEMEAGVRYQILDMAGREVLLSGTLNSMTNEIDLSSLYAGLFILKLKTGESSETHKLIRL